MRRFACRDWHIAQSATSLSEYGFGRYRARGEQGAVAFRIAVGGRVAESENEHQALNRFRPETVRRRRSVWPMLIIIAGLGAGAFYVLNGNGTSALLSLPWGQSFSHWTVAMGRPNLGEAEVCLRQGDISCAEADLYAYVNKYPNDSRATAMLAMTLTADGRHEEALPYYRRAESMGIGTYDFYANYAKSLDAMGDTDGAIAKNRMALDIAPTLVDVRGALANELVRKGRRQEAIDLLTEFDNQLEAEGQNPYFTAQIHRIKMQMGGEPGTENVSLRPNAPGQTLIRGVPQQGTLAVPVSIDGAQVKYFTVDSGASFVTIPNSDARPLIAKGLIAEGDYRGLAKIVLADGTIEVARLYTLRSVKVGDSDVENVLAAVYPGEGVRLLGQSFLKRFKSWSIDNDRRVLVLTN